MERRKLERNFRKRKSILCPWPFTTNKPNVLSMSMRLRTPSTSALRLGDLIWAHFISLPIPVPPQRLLSFFYLSLSCTRGSHLWWPYGPMNTRSSEISSLCPPMPKVCRTGPIPMSSQISDLQNSIWTIYFSQVSFVVPSVTRENVRFVFRSMAHGNHIRS